MTFNTFSLQVSGCWKESGCFRSTNSCHPLKVWDADHDKLLYLSSRTEPSIYLNIRHNDKCISYESKLFFQFVLGNFSPLHSWLGNRCLLNNWTLILNFDGKMALKWSEKNGNLNIYFSMVTSSCDVIKSSRTATEWDNDLQKTRFSGFSSVTLGQRGNIWEKTISESGWDVYSFTCRHKSTYGGNDSSLDTFQLNNELKLV